MLFTLLYKVFELIRPILITFYFVGRQRTPFIFEGCCTKRFYQTSEISKLFLQLQIFPLELVYLVQKILDSSSLCWTFIATDKDTVYKVFIIPGTWTIFLFTSHWKDSK